MLKQFMTLESRLESCPVLLGMKTISGNDEFWLDLNEELNSNLYQNPLPYIELQSRTGL